MQNLIASQNYKLGEGVMKQIKFKFLNLEGGEVK